MSEPVQSCSAESRDALIKRLQARVDAHDKACFGSTMALGYYSGNDARLMRDAIDALRLVPDVAQAVPVPVMRGLTAEERDLVRELHQAAEEYDRGHGVLHAAAANAIEHLTTLHAADIDLLKADIRDSRAINDALREEIDRLGALPQPSAGAASVRDGIAAIINDRTMINDEGFVQNSEFVADLILKGLAVLNEPQAVRERKDELLAFFLAFFDGWTPGTQLTVTDMDALERGRAKVAAMSSPLTRPELCSHEAIISLDGKWHCQKCGDAIEMATAYAHPSHDRAPQGE